MRQCYVGERNIEGNKMIKMCVLSKMIGGDGGRTSWVWEEDLQQRQRSAGHSITIKQDGAGILTGQSPKLSYLLQVGMVRYLGVNDRE
jgi:hypothetical protein